MSQHSDSLPFAGSPGTSFFLPLLVALPGALIVALAVILNWGR